ncbi:MAG TPA: glycosyltransferase family 1 protein [Anaerolineales bacterium]|nr:glycosyltransferase family 1 protein [Anaerolineales bacterium]
MNKIAVNGRCLTRRITGVERYAREISKRLAGSHILQPQNGTGQVAGNLWEQVILPGQLKHDEILWSPANAGPWLVKNQVITIHDASVFDHPEWFKPAFAAWTRLSWQMLARRVRAIITVSNFSCERLKHHLKIPTEKIHVVHNGVGKPFAPQTQPRIDAVRSKYGIQKPYFLFVGTIEPRKNLGGLLQAWNRAGITTHELFIAGARGRVFQPISGAPNIVYNVHDDDLPALYSGAAAFIIPSFYEGFGLTALEAMACGTPVIASRTTVFPETLGEAAQFIDPYSVNQLSDAMRAILEDSALAATLRKHGLEHASRFSWDESARKTQEIICAAGGS